MEGWFSWYLVPIGVRRIASFLTLGVSRLPSHTPHPHPHPHLPLILDRIVWGVGGEGLVTRVMSGAG